MDQDAQGKLSSSACAFCTHLPDLQSFEDGVLQKDHTKNRKNLVSHICTKNNTKCLVTISLYSFSVLLKRPTLFLISTMQECQNTTLIKFYFCNWNFV